MQSLPLEVRSKGAFAIGTVLQRSVAVCTERTRQHTDVSEDALRSVLVAKTKRTHLVGENTNLERFVEDVRHFVL